MNKTHAVIVLASVTISFAMALFISRPPAVQGSSAGTVTLPVLWSAGGISSGNDGAGQAARMATDASGNIAIASAPYLATRLAVTSYSASGDFRWRSSISPSSGTFVADWVAAGPQGEFVAVGHNVSSSGNPIGISMVRFDSNGAEMWRLDLVRTLPAVGRLLVDPDGNAYLAFNAVGDGQDIELHKYSAGGILLWSQSIATGSLSNDIAASLAFNPDASEIALSGSVTGGATWITALFDTLTGAQKWLVTAPEGVAAGDVVVDSDNVYVTGKGNIGIDGYLTVVAYDRISGSKLWRTDAAPSDSTGAAGLRMALAPSGNLLVAGQATRGFLDWYTIALAPDGTLLWEAVRDGGLNTDELPRHVIVLADGTTVVTGPGGPPLPGGFIQGVTAGYSQDGTLLWEAFSAQATVWSGSLPEGDVCATGGYDALITCWRISPWKLWLPAIWTGS